MDCPECNTENQTTRKFCGQCGAALIAVCTDCGSENIPGDQFCGECGHKLAAPDRLAQATEGEKKQVTVAFADLAGYTMMCERLEAEEVRQVVGDLFADIERIIAKYDGYIDKFVGDAVMAVFGARTAHEDNAIRAIMAAMEINGLARAVNPLPGSTDDLRLSMHIGINTGTIITQTADLDEGRIGHLGDTANLASRLTQLAGPGEIVVGSETCRQAEQHFNFEALAPTKIKGKAQQVRAHRLVSAREEPASVRRVSGLRAKLIGRQAELAQLNDAMEQVRRGQSQIVVVCGEAGVGKSRLVEDFKTTLDLKETQWREAHSYPYARNTPYFPLIDMISRYWQINEGDSVETVMQKIEANLTRLLGKAHDAAPFIGGLYSLDYPGVDKMSPEFWRSRLHEVLRQTLTAVVRAAPTVFCLDDLHWTDPSSIEVLRSLMAEGTHPALFICTYRPPFALFSAQEISGLPHAYREIVLDNISPSEAKDMVESLLGTKDIPAELRQLVQAKAEGNPFYLEEVVNSLVEAKTLTRRDGSWHLAKTLSQADAPPTVQGVIQARLDHLDATRKRVLQEAAVIGREFPLDVLCKITKLETGLDTCLGDLESFGLIRVSSLGPERGYTFKHALTQEVVYNSLLRNERQDIHEEIASIMEVIFKGRLSEFYEALAFHFSRGRSSRKAVDYLIKSGVKSYERYAVQEAHGYFKEAFQLLDNEHEKTAEDSRLAFDILNKWAEVFLVRGDFAALLELVEAHEPAAKSLGDKAVLGMVNVWMGIALYYRERFPQAYDRLQAALKLGEEAGAGKVVNDALGWLSSVSMELGRMDEALAYAERIKELSGPTKDYAGAANTAYWGKGYTKKALAAGREVLEFGLKESDLRSIAVGHCNVGNGYMVDEDYEAAIECFEKALEISTDPWLSQAPNALLGLCFIYSGRFDEAEGPLNEVLAFGQRFGVELVATPAQAMLGVVRLARGELTAGMKMLKDARKHWLKNGARWRYLTSEHVLGSIHLRLVEKNAAGGRINFSAIVRNVGFLVLRGSMPARRAELHFRKTVDGALEVGAKGLLGQALLGLARLYKLRGNRAVARQYALEAAEHFEEYEAEAALGQTRQLLASLEESGTKSERRRPPMKRGGSVSSP